MFEPERPDTGAIQCPSYTVLRTEILGWVPPEADRILDVGCSTGTLGEALKQARGGREVIGIELDAAAARQANKRLDRVFEGDVEKIGLAEAGIPDGYFHCIVYGDILEHCRDPWALLGRHRPFLAPEGCVVASLPNVQHWAVLASLVAGNWPHKDRGIWDRTHLRFFTLRTMLSMFEGAGYRIVKMRRLYRLRETPMQGNAKLGLMVACALFPLRNFLTGQYVFLLKPNDRE